MQISDMVRSELVNHNIDVVSFDIFDTLLLRTTRKTYQVFDRAYELAKECFPEYISARDWRAIRMTLPTIAKKKKDSSYVSLSDYLNEVPFFVKDIEKLHKAEINAEKESVVLNPDIISILRECKNAHGKKIILISDKYLTKMEICDILISANMDMELIDNIFISVEYGKRKSKGDLYQFVSQEIECEPDRILHIGDNYVSDYLNAKKAGYRALHYSPISFATLYHPYLSYESTIFHNSEELGNSLYAIRCIAAAHNNLSGEEKEWFTTGAMTFGPLLTFAAEWVIKCAEEYNIKNIYPFMREGLFLSCLLKKAAAYCKWNGRIEPMYVSRQALFPALLAVIEHRDITFSFLANTGISRNLTVGDVLSMYKVGIDDELYQYQHVKMSDAHNLYHHGKPVTEIMNERFFADIEQTRRQSSDADTMIWEYFRTLNMDKEPFITFDFGYGGTTQNAIERILHKRGSTARGLHLLVVGKSTIESRGNYNNNTDIRGFASVLSGDKEYTDAMNNQINDSLLKCRYGSITGYTYKEGKIVPTFDNIDYNPKTIHLVEAFQQGILEFQNTYYSICTENNKSIKCSRSDLLKIAARLSVFPTKLEAQMMGELSSDGKRISNYNDIGIYQDMGKEAYFCKRYSEGVARRWYQGMDVIIDGLKYYKQSLMSVPINNEFIYAAFASVVTKSFERFSIVGTVNEVMFFSWAVILLDAWSQVEYVVFVDHNINGESFISKEVISMNDTRIVNRLILLSRDRKEVARLKGVITQVSPNCILFDLYSNTVEYSL